MTPDIVESTRKFARSVFAVGLIIAATAGSAGAAVHPNPDSPANKEYQIPLDQAKGAAGTTTSAKTLPNGKQVADKADTGGGLAVPLGIGVAVLAVGLGVGFALRSRDEGNKPDA